MNATARMRPSSTQSDATIPCDVCHGSKVTSAFVDTANGTGFTQNMPCPECEGSGTIPTVRMNYRIHGADCRQIRKDMCRTLAEVAGSMGTNIAYVDRMERGINDPRALLKYWGLLK
jgi:hypothetical protein